MTRPTSTPEAAGSTCEDASLPKLDILLIYDAFNSMSQRAFGLCTELGHRVQAMVYSEEKTLEILNSSQAVDVIVCPFLTKILPKTIYAHPLVPCLIIHPGIAGDRGVSSLDWALFQQKETWGVTILQADADVDVGPIYATQNFSLRRQLGDSLTKSSVYRKECIPAAMACLEEALLRVQRGQKGTPLDYSHPAIQGTFNPRMKQVRRKIDWSLPAHQLVKLCNASDSQPGVREEFDGTCVVCVVEVSRHHLFCRLGQAFLLYGFIEKRLFCNEQTAAPCKTLLGHRHEAVLVQCGDGSCM